MEWEYMFKIFNFHVSFLRTTYLIKITRNIFWVTFLWSIAIIWLVLFLTLRDIYQWINEFLRL